MQFCKKTRSNGTIKQHIKVMNVTAPTNFMIIAVSNVVSYRMIVMGGDYVPSENWLTEDA
jgi:hypothetical protein